MAKPRGAQFIDSESDGSQFAHGELAAGKGEEGAGMFFATSVTFATVPRDFTATTDDRSRRGGVLIAGGVNRDLQCDISDGYEQYSEFNKEPD